MYTRASTFVCVLAVASLVVAAAAFAGGLSSGQQVRVAQGRVAHHYWALKVQGKRQRRCYELSLRGKSVVNAVGTCTSDRHRSPLWSRLVGATGGNNAATVELNITRTRVRKMRVRIGHPNTDRPPNWIRVHNRRITRREARKASVRRNFRFAVLHSRGTLCVKRVILFNRQGHRIDDQRVPCEF